MRASILVGLLLLMFTSAGCGDGGWNMFKTTPNFYPTAQQNYEYGLTELKGSNWLVAIQFFEHVKKNFGFSKYATLAELGLADANLGREKYTEAIEGYKQFIKAHPSNERVTDGYAPFKICQCYMKEIPSDWLLAPPAYEKDQGPVVDAMRELETFMTDYHDSPHRAQAEKYLAQAIQRIADHELYVAKFYLDRNHPYAAIGRLEHLVREYPSSKREPETLLLLGKTYMKMNKLDLAKTAFEKLRNEHPEDFRAGKAQLYIDFINAKPKS